VPHVHLEHVHDVAVCGPHVLEEVHWVIGVWHLEAAANTPTKSCGWQGKRKREGACLVQGKGTWRRRSNGGEGKGLPAGRTCASVRGEGGRER
jgi:hypothetical protein